MRDDESMSCQIIESRLPAHSFPQLHAQSDLTVTVSE